MTMGMGQVGSQEQFRVRKNLRWAGIGDDRTLLQYNSTIRDVFHNVELVSGRHDGLDSPFPLMNQCDNLARSGWVESGSRFVQKKNVRIKHHDRRKRHSLFFPT